MTITLYKTASRKNAINKSLSNARELSGAFRSETNLINPAILIEAPINAAAQYNYVYIPSFKRYYYINDIVSVTNKTSEIILSLDVLMSYKDYLMNANGIIERSTNLKDGYLNDNEMVTKIYNNITTQPFPNKMNAESYVFGVAGFGATQ